MTLVFLFSSQRIAEPGIKLVGKLFHFFLLFGLYRAVVELFDDTDRGNGVAGQWVFLYFGRAVESDDIQRLIDLDRVGIAVAIECNSPFCQPANLVNSRHVIIEEVVTVSPCKVITIFTEAGWREKNIAPYDLKKDGK